MGGLLQFVWLMCVTVRGFCRDLRSSLSALHRPAPKNEDEMMVAIFEYIDRLFNIVRPRRVLYMAIDGVVNNTQ